MAPVLTHAASDVGERELVLRWAPIPGTAQEDFFDNDEPDASLLFQGGWGSGKTITLTAKILKLSAINFPLRGIWTVPDFGHVEDTVLETLKSTDPETGLPWLLEESQFHYNQQKHVLTWAAGGPIQFASGENPDSIAGPNVAFAGMDEPGSSPFKAWKNTNARVRHPGAPLRQTVLAGTSEGLNHIADLFGPDRDAGYYRYVMTMEQNIELIKHHPKYRDQVAAMATEAELQAYLEGKTVNMAGGLAHPAFDADRQYRRLELNANLPLRLSFDFNVDPMSLVVGQQWAGPAGTEYGVLIALALPVSTVDQVCDAFIARYPTHRAGLVIYGDASGKARSQQSLKSNYDLIKERLKDVGPLAMKVPAANPPVTTRLNSVNRLCLDARKVTRLFLHGDAQAPRSSPTRDLVRSLQQTIKKPGTDDIWKKPGDTVTHLGEALGYWLTEEEPAQKPDHAVATIKAPAAGRGVSNTLAEMRAAKTARRRQELEQLARRRG